MTRTLKYLLSLVRTPQYWQTHISVNCGRVLNYASLRKCWIKLTAKRRTPPTHPPTHPSSSIRIHTGAQPSLDNTHRTKITKHSQQILFANVFISACGYCPRRIFRRQFSEANFVHIKTFRCGYVPSRRNIAGSISLYVNDSQIRII